MLINMIAECLAKVIVGFMSMHTYTQINTHIDRHYVKVWMSDLL